MTKSADAVPASLDAILEMRDEYRREMACQIVHDAWHARGFTDAYLLRLDGEVVGYGAVGGAPREPRHAVKEFYLRPDARPDALLLFRRLVVVSGARSVEAQTNDRLLFLLLLDVATDITSETILFEDVVTTAWPVPNGIGLARLTEADRGRVFPHTREPVGEWGLAKDGQFVATGGILTHYNAPFGDLHMEVAAACQRQGLGTYLVQELKRLCREAGRVPAARCRADNAASRRTLERAGLLPCARIVRGRIGRA